MATTAEGVETVQQYQLLRMAGVTSLQGYLFKRPFRLQESISTAFTMSGLESPRSGLGCEAALPTNLPVRATVYRLGWIPARGRRKRPSLIPKWLLLLLFMQIA